jgi:hypothetical protein
MARKSEPAPTSPLPRRHDLRPYIYCGLDQLFAIAYGYVVAVALPNRLPSASIHLWTFPVLMQLFAIGTSAAWWPAGRRVGWWIAIGAGSALLLSTIVLIARLIASAAFLAGVYGAFGQAAAQSVIVGVALVIQFVAMLPVVQIRYLRSRAGRRVYA